MHDARQTVHDEPNFRNHLVNEWATLARGKTARDLILLEAILLPGFSVENGLDFLLGLAVALAPPYDFSVAAECLPS